MSATLVIAARELRGKGRLLGISAALAVLPFLAALMPAARGNRGDVIVMLAGFLAAAMGLGLAVALGASTVGKELTERRMSFYFARPVSPVAIWAGKATAALLISLGAFAVIALPAYFADRHAWRVAWLGDFRGFLLAIVALFLLSHAMSTALRPRSALIALDFVCLCAAVVAVPLLVRPLLLGLAFNLAKGLLLGLAVAVALLLAVAPAWQLARGRTDLRRNHLEFSRFFWSGVGAVLLLAAAVVTWTVSVAPRDIVDVLNVDQAPAGNRFLVTGETANRGGLNATFVMDATNGVVARVASPPWWGSAFSRDGQVVAWLQAATKIDLRRMTIGSQLELHALVAGSSEEVVVGAPLSHNAVVALSDDGARAAVLDGNKATVYEVATGKLLAAAAGLNSNSAQTLFFVSPDVVRIVEEDGRRGAAQSAYKIFELDVAQRSMRQTGATVLPTASSGRRGVAASGDGSLLWLRAAGVIANGRTGEPVATLPLAGAQSSVMLYDGSVAATGRNADGSLRIFAPDGVLKHDVKVASEGRVFVSAETETEKLILLPSPKIGGAGHRTGAGRRMLVLDLASGVVERSVAEVRGPLPEWSATRAIRYEAGTRFVAVDAQGELVTWDAQSGTKKKLEL